jgi:hypothetical protein
MLSLPHMTPAFEDDDVVLPLLRRAAPSEAIEEEQDPPRRPDRLEPATAGALIGAFAGTAGLGVVHAMHASRIEGGMLQLAATFDVPADAAMPLAYLAAGIVGVFVCAGFASLTRHLRRFVPLLLWAVVFFVSLTMLALAISSAYGRGLGVPLAPAILAASGVFAFVASFQLPLRVRR